ncbi:MAG TPA: oligosaccharide flippase family protein, partial [Candidatus Eisenbacteria bacterium]|nr:oligosaccharide flippase family protein [Candidatus Eisenbacteria bacterium]
MTFTGRLLSGTFQLALSNGILRLLPVATMPVLTTLLSPQVYGVTTLVGTVISLMSVFALVGIDVSYARAYHSARPPSGARVEHYCWRFAILAAVVTAVFASVGWWFINKDSVELDGCLPILVGLGIIFSVLHTMAQTRARLASRYRAIAL